MSHRAFNLVGAVDADELGLEAADLGTLFQAAGELTKGAATMAEKDKAEKKSAADEKASLDAAITTDRAAAQALARADASEQLKSKSAAVDRDAADAAESSQDRAAEDLSADAQKKRAAAAETEHAKAVTAAQAAPTDPYKVALVKAWTKVVNKAHGGAIVKSGKEKDGKGAEVEKADHGSWLTRKIAGPIPGYGVVAGGIGLAGITGLVVKKLFLHS